MKKLINNMDERIEKYDSTYSILYELLQYVKAGGLLTQADVQTISEDIVDENAYEKHDEVTITPEGIKVSAPQE